MHEAGYAICGFCMNSTRSSGGASLAFSVLLMEHRGDPNGVHDDTVETHSTHRCPASGSVPAQ